METVEPIVLDTCKGCGKTFGVDCKRSNTNREYCRDCGTAARGLARKEKRDNTGWIEAALEQGIPLWEQQPGESNDEYELWLRYRDLWPEERPTVSRVSKATGTPVQTVQRAFTMWAWAARLQAWVREVTAEKTAETRRAKQAMVNDHIAMGEAMRKKAIAAIEAFDPYDVTPNELVSILKETQRLESTARDMLDDIEASTMADIDNSSLLVDAPAGLFVDGATTPAAGASPSLPRAGLSEAGLLEVASILANAGVLTVSQTVEVKGKEPLEAKTYDL